MKTLSKLVTVLAVAIVAIFPARADQYVNADMLPDNAKTFIQKNYASEGYRTCERDDDGHYDVNRVQDRCRLAHFGNQLAHVRAGAFRPQQVHGKAGALLAGNHRQQKYQHAHASHPVAEAAPIENALGKCLHIRQNGCAGGGKAGYDLKQRVDKKGNLAGDHKGQAAQQTHNHPAQANTDQAFPGAEKLACLPADQKQQSRQGDHNAQGDAKAKNRVPLPKAQTDDQRRYHKYCFDRDNLGGKPPHHLTVHSLLLKRKCR